MFKKLGRFTAAVIAAGVLILSGCSNFTAEDALVNGVTTTDKCVVNITIGDIDEDYTRTILPTAWTTEAAAALTYKISGTSSRGETLTEKVLTFTSASSSLSLSYSLWELTLTAYNASGNPVLTGNTFVDLTNGRTTPISFVLSSKNLTTAGSVALSGTYTDTESVVKKIEMGLYSFDTGTLIGSLTTDTTCNTTFSYSNASVTPGTYLFGMKFYLESGKQVGYWSDMVIVAAGKDSTKTDIAIPDIIFSKPTAPANLKAYLVDNSESSNGSYNVKLTWEDKSINEENFVITVTEYTSADDTTGSVFKIFGKETDASANKEIFWGSQYRASGSIIAGNTTCTITLPTGRLFDVSIQSQNYAGLSDVCARVAGGTETDCTAFDAYSSSNKNRINRVMLTYVLQGGTLQTSSTESYSSVNYVEYKTYAGSNFKVYGYDMENAGGSNPTYQLKVNSETTSTTTYPILRKGNHPFQKWVDADGTEVKESSGFSNLSVMADYNLTYVISYTIEGYTDMAADRVTATYDSTWSSSAGDKTNCKNGTIIAGTSAGANANPPITFTVTAATGSEVEYDSYRIRIDGADIYAGTSNTYTYSSTFVTELDSGTHIVNVFAKKKDTTEWYSNTFAITISR